MIVLHMFFSPLRIRSAGDVTLCPFIIVCSCLCAEVVGNDFGQVLWLRGTNRQTTLKNRHIEFIFYAISKNMHVMDTCLKTVLH
jgi:hypothetical protein